MILAFLACAWGVKAAGTFTYQVNGVDMKFKILDSDPLGVYTNTVLIGDGTNPCINKFYNNALELPFNAYNSSDGKWYTVRGINHNAFKYCYNLRAVGFSQYMLFIGDYAFQGCSSLDYVTIPTNDPKLYDNITTIGEGAFKDCSSLSTINLGSSIESIDSDAFSGCTGITKVKIDNLKAWCNITFGNESANPARYNFTAESQDSPTGSEDYPILYLGGVKLTNLVIPNTVTTIKDYAFTNYWNLTSVTIPSSVNTIGKSAFQNCKNLTTVNGMGGVTDVGVNAFIDTKWYDNQADGLIYIGKCLYKYKGTMPAHTKIIVADGTKSIGYDAFKDCSGLEILVLPSSVEKIGFVALGGCGYLTDFYCLIEDPAVLDYNFTFPSPEKVTLHVPEASMNAYRAYQFWLKCKEIVPLIEYNLYVAGTRVNELNADDIQGDGRVSFDTTNGNVLHLNRASISIDEADVSGITDMISDQELVVVVNGDNTVESKQWDAFRARGNVHFKGNGTLRLKGYSWGLSCGSGVAMITLSDGVHLICEGGERDDANGGFGGFYNERRHTWETTLEISGYGTMLECKGNANGNGSLHDIKNLNGRLAITAPNGAVFNSTKHAICDASGNIIKGSWVIIEAQSGISTNINEAYGQRDSVKGQRDARYNLSGQRVGKDYKGIVIHNGKKVVIK
jgi:hypothetical protein